MARIFACIVTALAGGITFDITGLLLCADAGAAIAIGTIAAPHVLAMAATNGVNTRCSFMASHRD